MPSGLQGMGANVLSSMGPAGLRQFSDAFDRLQTQQMFDRSVTEDRAREEREEERRKKLLKEQRRQQMLGIAATVGTSALMGGFDELTAPAVSTVTDAATQSAGQAGKEAVSDFSSQAGEFSRAANDAAKIPEAARFTGDMASSGPVSLDNARTMFDTTGAMQPQANMTPERAMFSRTANSGGLEPVHEDVLRPSPRNDNVGQMLDRGGETTYNPNSGAYTNTPSSGGNFGRGMLRGAAQGGLWSLASMYPGVAPVAQSFSNRADPLYRAKIGEISSRQGYNDARTNRVNELLDPQIQSEVAQAFQRNAAGANSLSSAGYHDAGTAKRNRDIQHIDNMEPWQIRSEMAQGDADFSLADRRDADTQTANSLRAPKVVGAWGDAAQKTGAGTREWQNVSFDRNEEGRKAELFNPTLKGKNLDNERKLFDLNQKQGAAFNDVSFFDDTVTPAEGIIASMPDADARHAAMEKYLSRWEGEVPEKQLISIERNWAKKYGFRRRLPKAQRTKNAMGLEYAR